MALLFYPPFPTAGNPAPPLATLQGNNNGLFGGVAGSTINFVNGLISLAPPGTGVALTITGDAHGSAALVVTSGVSQFRASVSLVAALLDGTGSAGTNGQVLSSTGTATKWVPNVAAGGSSGQLQFNSSGVFAGVSGSIVSGGSIGLGGSPAANAILDLQSTTLAFNPPRMTTTQKLAIASPTDGMVVYDTSLHSLCSYDSQSSLWITLTGQNTPVIPSPLNDTFTESSLSSQWTIIGTNSNYSYTLANGRLTLAGNNASVDNLFGIVQPISDATPWMYATLLSFQTPFGSTPLCNGIVVGNGLGQYICWGFDSITELDAVKWNSTTSVAGSLGFLPNGASNTCYLGIQNDGAGNLNFMFSADGINFVPFGTTLISNFLGSVTQIGLAIDARTQTATSYVNFFKVE